MVDVLFFSFINRGIYYDRIDITPEKSLPNGAFIPSIFLKEMILTMITRIETKPTCVLSNVIDDPYLLRD